MTNTNISDTLIIAGREFSARLIVGTGKYASYAQNREALAVGPRAGQKAFTLQTLPPLPEKSEQVRIDAWRLRILRWAEGGSNSVRKTHGKS